MTGTIKSKPQDKMFGFIKPDDGSADVFFHQSVVTGGTFEELQVGDKVNFESTPGEEGKGPKATTVSKAQ